MLKQMVVLLESRITACSIQILCNVQNQTNLKNDLLYEWMTQAGTSSNTASINGTVELFAIHVEMQEVWLTNLRHHLTATESFSYVFKYLNWHVTPFLHMFLQFYNTPLKFLHSFNSRLSNISEFNHSVTTGHATISPFSSITHPIAFTNDKWTMQIIVVTNIFFNFPGNIFLLPHVR